MKRKYLWTSLLAGTVLALAAASYAVATVNTPWMRDLRIWLYDGDDWAERRARLAAGFGAADCGGTGFPAADAEGQRKLALVDGCVERNYRAQRAFRVAYAYNCTDGCREIRAWNPRWGLTKLMRAGVDTYTEENCADARLLDEPATDWAGKVHKHRTVGCE